MSHYYEKFKFLIRLKINNPAKIVQNIISKSKDDGGKSLVDLTNSFQNENELEPIRCLTGQDSLLEKEQLLVNSPFGDKIKEALPIIAVLAPIVLTLIGITINFLKNME